MLLALRSLWEAIVGPPAIPASVGVTDSAVTVLGLSDVLLTTLSLSDSALTTVGVRDALVA